MVHGANLGIFEVLVLFLGVEERTRDMRQDKGALCANKDRASVWQFIPFQKSEDFGGRFLRTVIPRHLERGVGSVKGAGEDVLDSRVHGPIPLIGGDAFITHRDGRAQIEGIKNGIENMAPHVAKCSGAEIEPFAPISRMIVLSPNKRPTSANAEPEVPVKAGG